MDKINPLQKLWNIIKDFFYGISVKINAKRNKRGARIKKVTKGQMQRNKLGFVWLGLSIPLINFIIFYFYVNLSSIDMAFRHPIDLNNYFYDFSNFIAVYNEFINPYSQIREAIMNTLKYFVWGLCVMTPLCYLVSYFIYKKIWLSGFFRVLFFLPSIISGMIMATFFKFMVAPDGPLTALISNLGFKNILVFSDSRTALWGLIFFGAWFGFGSSLIYYTANLQRIPKDLIEAGEIDGINTWTEIRYILFPLTWPFVSTMIFLSFVGIFGSGGAALLLTGGAFGTYDFPFWQYKRTQDSGISAAYQSAALGWLITLVSLPIALIFKRLANKAETPEY